MIFFRECDGNDKCAKDEIKKKLILPDDARVMLPAIKVSLLVFFLQIYFILVGMEIFGNKFRVFSYCNFLI